MQKSYTLIGNWKMTGTPETWVDLAQGVTEYTDTRVKHVLCPPSLAVPFVEEVVFDSAVSIGVQDVHAADEGAFTGDISVTMAKACGAEYALVGHSERRDAYQLSNADIAARAQACVAQNIVPVICIGESEQVYKSGDAFTYLETQLKESLEGVQITSETDILIAYEPIWAIGTGLVPTEETLQKTFEHLHAVVKMVYPELGERISLLYGGSVKADNAVEIARIPHIQGALVGGASLDAKGFCAIGQHMANEMKKG